MKFVCLNCETYMSFEKVEKPAEGSLGVFFGCPSCGAKFSMVTNPGETQMVSSLGVQLGGRSAAAEPFEMTRGTLKEEAQAGAGQMAAYLNEKIQAGQPASAHASAGKPASTSTPAGNPAEGSAKAGGGCPFSAMVTQMGLTASGSEAPRGALKSEFTWTADAKERLERLPAFVKPMVQSSIEAYARKQGYTTITLQVMDDSKNEANGVAWSPEAEKRLENIPDFIRPMARREIERMAKERGATTITAQVMDEAKETFMKFM
ncbi:MAG: PCP reductase family protein [Nitrospiraceae bacterium]